MQHLVNQEECKAIMKEAGSLLLSFWNKSDLKAWKKGTSIVTAADIAVEALLIEKFSGLDLRADFLAEESGISGTGGSGYRWVIDPIDGTRNFYHKIPYFSISVALTYHDEPVIGMIYNPLLDELFYTKEGGAVTLNGQPIAVAQRELSDALIVSRIAIAGINRRIGALRTMGSIALDMAYLAAGRFDGIIFLYPSWWDIAAGLYILRQAGGIMVNLENQETVTKGSLCIAGNAEIVDQLVKIVRNTH